MVETAQSVVLTARRGQNNCAAAHARSLEGTVIATLCESVVKSWENISVEAVEKSLKKCSISNAMDGTKDDMLWLDDDEKLNIISAHNIFCCE